MTLGQVLRVGDVEALERHAADGDVDLNGDLDGAAVGPHLEPGEVAATAGRARLSMAISIGCSVRAFTLGVFGPQPVEPVGDGQVAVQQARPRG